MARRRAAALIALAALAMPASAAERLSGEEIRLHLQAVSAEDALARLPQAADPFTEGLHEAVRGAFFQIIAHPMRIRIRG